MRIELLGGFALTVNGTRIDSHRWNLRRARALVTMLALAPKQRLGRDEVIEQLWPGMDFEAGSHSLHQVMYVARRALGAEFTAGWFTVQRQDVVLYQHDGVAVDVLEFERLAEAALLAGDQDSLRRALKIYGGDLLPEVLDIDWLASRRASLSATRRAVLLGLAERLRDNGSNDQALRLFEQTLESDPHQEVAVRGVMQVLACCGRGSEAISRYNTFRATLAEAMGTDPDERTQALFQRLLARSEVRAESRVKDRLPLVQSSFVGRARELVEIERLLQRGRLITLVGAGGAGKTRLAVEVARHAGDSYADGVGLVDLSGLAEPGLLADVVATALGLTPSAGQEANAALTEQLGSSAMMIVLDNCEHLLGSCSRLAVALLAHCPKIKVLATSREPLRVVGERTFRVPSLELPQPTSDGGLDVESLAQVASIRLFVDRAEHARSDFVFGPLNAGAVADICLRLDGMPLALELAAARVALMEPAEMLERLDDVLSTVGAGPIGISRHQTLRAALGWSLDLLPDDEKCMMQRLSVFAGGFTLAAAEAVCAGDPLEPSQILGLLGSLVDKSLVNAAYSGSRTRYRLLETVRQFCAEQLVTAEGSSQVSAEHCAHYLGIARAHDPEDMSGVVLGDYTDLDSEHDNFRAALRWSLTADPAAGLEIAACLWRFWFFRCHVVEGAEWVEQTLHAAPSPTPARAKALIGLTGLDARRGRSHLIRAQSAAAVDIGRQIFDPPTLASYQLAHSVTVWATSDVQEAESIALSVRSDPMVTHRQDLLACSSWVLAHCALTREDAVSAGDLLDRCLLELEDTAPESRSFFPVITPCSMLVQVGGRRVPTYEESLLVGRRVGAAQSVGFVLAAMGYVARLSDDLAAARLTVGRAVAQFTSLADDLGRAQALNQLGCILRDAGDFEGSASCLAEARSIRQIRGERRGEWMTTANLSLLHAKIGDLELGRRTAKDCLAAFRAVQDRPSIANAWAALANIELVAGDLPAALELYERAVCEFESQSWPRVEAWHLLLVAELATDLGAGARAQAALDRASMLLKRQRSSAAQIRLDALRRRIASAGMADRRIRLSGS